jgi:hypothetical protein
VQLEDARGAYALLGWPEGLKTSISIAACIPKMPHSRPGMPRMDRSQRRSRTRSLAGLGAIVWIAVLLASWFVISEWTDAARDGQGDDAALIVRV